MSPTDLGGYAAALFAAAALVTCFPASGQHATALAAPTPAPKAPASVLAGIPVNYDEALVRGKRIWLPPGASRRHECRCLRPTQNVIRALISIDRGSLGVDEKPPVASTICPKSGDVSDVVGPGNQTVFAMLNASARICNFSRS